MTRDDCLWWAFIICCGIVGTIWWVLTIPIRFILDDEPDGGW